MTRQSSAAPAGTTTPVTLTAHSLRKAYHGRTVVTDVSLDVRQGEVVGLLGPNGAGKSTCFHMLAGLVPADGGGITLGDDDITGADMHRRARLGLGYLPQETSVFRRMTVRDNLLCVLELRRELDDEARRTLLEELLAEFRLGHLADRYGLSLSGGERRRVEIARARATVPRFMLLDEPFAGIDPVSISELQAMVRRLSAHRIGVLITDHNVRETLGICHRAYIIGDGRVLCAGTPDEVQADPRVRDAYLGRDFRLD
ncbi:MAG: LPS export ABC transporter ATP-binding protein [Gammaproteobacteria bacterium]|nr:LPS export ABC transporter ATP-binding protein [Gammaproteobacteria bacterium]